MVRVASAAVSASGCAPDPVANDYTLAQLIRGARLKLYPDAGHAFLFQDENAFVPPLESFLH
jgi:hypothetical protein